MGGTYQVRPLADGKVVTQVHIEQVFFHGIDNGAHIIRGHIRTYEVEPLCGESLHQCIDLIFSVQHEEFSGIGRCLEGNGIYQALISLFSEHPSSKAVLDHSGVIGAVCSVNDTSGSCDTDCLFQSLLLVLNSE